ncbi:hypothetical protein HK098_006183 [Nowakowskiella sp. JEL0407]|nr:hypothetical protein HK098_006183 [Nowakowskiella sp. JEL0407]
MAKETYIVIGGAGFLGSAVVRQLAARGESVTSFDLRPSKFPDYPSVRNVTGDITNIESVKSAIRGHTTVIHTASPIHGNNATIFFKVNVDGTKNVLDACVECGVKSMVYTSSASVIYNGGNLFYADETVPYPKVHMDAYNESKAIAEDMVLKANGKGGLLTSCIRPSGVYGPVENQFLDALYDMVLSGRNYKFYIGDNTNLYDYTEVDNVAHAHLLAADKLSQQDPKVAGETFIVTDDAVRPFWDIHKEFFQYMGVYDTHTINIPLIVAFFIAYITEFFVLLLKPIKQIHPTFTLFRIKVSAGNRYFNISKAKKYLGYKPVISQEEGLKRAALYYKKKLENAKRR